MNKNVNAVFAITIIFLIAAMAGGVIYFLISTSNVADFNIVSY